MKEIILWVNYCFTIIGAPIVLILFGIDEKLVSKEQSLVALIIWLYFLGVYLVIKNKILSKEEKAKIIKEFLEWRLKKPHSDFQTRDFDVDEFLKVKK